MPGTQNSETAYLGLGSNLKQPTRQLHRAIYWLNQQAHIQVMQTSPWYQTSAWGVTDQPDFINAVVSIRTALTPLMLLKTIKKIEYKLMQRQPEKRWHARCIDIDILLYGLQTINHSNLKIPHPLITARCFVIHPLLQLRPLLPASLKKMTTAHLKNHACQSTLKPLRHRKGKGLTHLRG